MRSIAFRFFAFLFIVCTQSDFSFAQIQVGDKAGLEGPTGTAKLLKPADLDLFKASTLLFTIQDKDAVNIASFKSEIAKTWNITKFDVISIADIDQYLNKPGYSFASFAGISYDLLATTGSSSRGGTLRGQSVYEYAYEIWMPNAKKANRYSERLVISRILLIASVETYEKTDRMEGTYEKIKFDRGIPVGMYKTAVFRNWGAGLLKGYLKVINDALLNNKSMDYTDSPVENENTVNALKSDTLYIPDYVKHLRQTEGDSKKSADEEDDKSDDQDYKFVVKYVSVDELNSMITTTPKPIFYLTFYLGSSGKFINVFESGSGKMIYRDHIKNLSFNFKKADLKKISKQIK